MEGNAKFEVTVEQLGWNHSQLASQAQGKLESIVLPAVLQKCSKKTFQYTGLRHNCVDSVHLLIPSRDGSGSIQRLITAKCARGKANRETVYF